MFKKSLFLVMAGMFISGTVLPVDVCLSLAVSSLVV